MNCPIVADYKQRCQVTFYCVTFSKVTVRERPSVVHEWSDFPGSRNLLWGKGEGGGFTRGAAMYAKLFQLGRCSPLTAKYQNWRGGGGAVGKLK